MPWGTALLMVSMSEGMELRQPVQHRASPSDGPCPSPAQWQKLRVLQDSLQERHRGAEPSSGQDGQPGEEQGWEEGWVGKSSLHLKLSPLKPVWWCGEPCSPHWRARLR